MSFRKSNRNASKSRRNQSPAQRKKAFIARNLHVRKHDEVMAYLYNYETLEAERMLKITKRLLAEKQA
ncbi:hypothetical protein SAMN05428949_4282 [Chitinophaga sp. YR627]|uniref:hypothetical protein n=1 Tax=Chitinophaga sp. YR627 TaxID=1881041 RepID=UPI0008E39121|nr:hypothetical protein [Chitinophaga sp. YR627]SFO15886.1 hypothetical protein SAMN05428949_4282 [Chitinophaga sp. YR627]